MSRCGGFLLCLWLVLLPVYALPVSAQESFADDEEVAQFEVCFDFGCASRQRIFLFQSDWQPVRMLLANSVSAKQERRRIAEAIALMESIVGATAPTGADRAGNDVPDSDASAQIASAQIANAQMSSGQMDCIDESTNATTYLLLFQNKGLLVWHRVLERVYRAPLVFDEHWAAQIEDLQSGVRYAVDSWPRAHARPAVLQELDQWLAKLQPPDEARLRVESDRRLRSKRTASPVTLTSTAPE